MGINNSKPDHWEEFYRKENERRERIIKGELYTDDECYNSRQIFNKRYWDLNYNPGLGTTCFEQDSIIHENIERDWKYFKSRYEKKHNLISN